MADQDRLLSGDQQSSESRAEEKAERERVRQVYLARLAEKLKDPEFRSIEGFPIGTDEAILALSDPPYYTACPNPFLEEWLAEHGTAYDPATDSYHREPFATDVSEGKNDPIYNAHSYHTKVPPHAIMRYILHYTEPGDLVYDGFCGTGMTGVAAQMCGEKSTVQGLDYTVREDGAVLDMEGHHLSWLGARKAILGDLSPAATFIAYNYNTPVDADEFEREAQRVLGDVEAECGWMYMTLHRPTSKQLEQAVSLSAEDLSPGLTSRTPDLPWARVNFTVWSEVFSCPECAGELVYMTEALDEKTQKIRESFPCPNCGAVVAKRLLAKVHQQVFDSISGSVHQTNKRVPVFIDYSVGAKRYQKTPDANDLRISQCVRYDSIQGFFPRFKLPYAHMTHERARLEDYGVTWFHHFFLPRQLKALATMWQLVDKTSDARIRHFLSYMVEQCFWGMSVLNRYSPTHFSQVNRYLSGVYYVPSQMSEVSPWYILNGKQDRLYKALQSSWSGNYVSLVATGDCALSRLPDESVMYVFTDPPFGENIYYADLNLLIEAWHRVRTDSTSEAIIDRAKHKGLGQYQDLMRSCFREYHRVLKSGRWMTMVFHNSAETVWNAIQEALQLAGFVVADVRILDKQQGSYRQVTSASAVKQDLVISCYKPRAEFEARFAAHQGEPEAAVEFVRQHLAMLPVAPHTAGGRLEVLAERTKYVLFDRVVGYHLVRGARIPLSSAELYRLLDQEFVERDGMYFLPDQAVRYDAERIRTDVEPLSLFIRDERSAVRWLRTQLTEKPLTLGQLTPAYMQELQAIESWDEVPELADLLKENFLRDPDGTWRVPDPDHEKDVEAMRRKGLLRTFSGYVQTRGRLKTFRVEALLEGFRECWQTKQCGIIVAVCEKVPTKTLQAIPELLQFYDIARDRAPEVPEQLTFTWEG
jgi:DNA modification methylase/predicted RNA-binding Zn-ribbon protein involved in translation (DUF1610 family)